MTVVLAAAGGSNQFIEAWLGPVATIVAVVLTGIFGPGWMNRRNARVTSAAAARKDEATAAQVVEQSSVSLIKEWRHIAEETKKEAAGHLTEIKRLLSQVTAAENAARNAERRAQIAEMQSVQAERRARDAEELIATLTDRVTVLEEHMRRLGVPPPGE